MIYPYIKYPFSFTSNDLGFYGLHALSEDLPVYGGFQHPNFGLKFFNQESVPTAFAHIQQN